MTDFSELGLKPPTLEAVALTGYTVATPIQAQAIPYALDGRDVLGIAQTGTGKTAAFTLPMIDRLVAGRAKARMPRSLVVEPTRELADQVAASFERYSHGQKLSWALLIGGVPFGEQEMKLDRGVDVLIATPGRLLDHFERGKLLLSGVQILVVDEADRMLDMGFIPDLERIFKLTPPVKQTLFFSATMPPEITRLTKQFLKDPKRIEASRPATAAETVNQHIVRTPSAEPAIKRLALRSLASREDVGNGIVFCNRKSEVDVVARSLKKHGFNAAPIHGDLDQPTRTRTLEAFRRGELKLLVASDVAARGLDIPDVSHIFNYDVPHHPDDYVHRIGRTGRAGRSGEAYMLASPADGRALEKVEKLIGSRIPETRLEIDWSQASETRRDPRRSGREHRPRHDDRKGGWGRPASETSVASMIPLPEAPAAPREPVSHQAERPSNAGPRRRRDRRAVHRPAAAAPEPRSERGPDRQPERTAERIGGRPSHEPGPRGPVRGFGDDLPAFLARPAPALDEEG